MSDNILYPDDPLTMPPPYWEDSGAIDQFIRSMEMVNELLTALAAEIKIIAPLVDDYHDRRDKHGEGYDPDYKEFGEITDAYMDFEIAIGSYADLCVLMVAITVESLINKFCVYNLLREVAEPLERLTLSEKLIIASALVGHPGVKSRAPYEAAKELTKWRNAFVHGHCIDHPTKTLHKNHFRKEPSGIEREAHVTVKMLKEAVNRFLCIYDYLSEVAKNPYVVSGDYENVLKIRRILTEIEKYQFSDVGLYFPYSLEKIE